MRFGKVFWRTMRLGSISCVLASFAALALSGDEQPVGIFEGHTDVGVTPKLGSASYDARRKEYTVTGGGANMWGAEDAFQFVWRRASGDVTISAGVSLQGTSGIEHRKAGLMIRQALSPSAAYADVLIHGDGLTALQYREKEGAETREIRSEMASPAFVRLERARKRFTLFVGDKKRHFTKVGSVEVELHDPVYVGLAVCSHDAEALQTAVFRKIEFKGR